ncbi:MAG TPA: SIR2 family protein [Xanthobacteraceae bacterium]|nr:SIR2 family protein [Xanthobacteraceae bacterium]
MFIGSGFTRRYFSGPNWKQLLNLIAHHIGSDHPIEYLITRYGDLPAVGTALIDTTFEWSWTKGKDYFPDGFLENSTRKSDPLKYIACDIIKKSIDKTKDKYLLNELMKFKAISPQAVITTNYDDSLECTLQGYQPVVGRDVYRYRIESMGEIYKIHGTVDDPQSIVLTTADYEKYSEQRRYVSAKMMTMFAENPVIILGYSLNDENVSKILCDVGEVIADDNGFIENIIFIQREDKSPAGTIYPETLPVTSNSRTYHIRRIALDGYLELFDILAETASLSNIKPHILKSFMSRMNDVVRVDIPSRRVEVTYDHIERISTERSAIPQLLGFSVTSNSNTDHPYTLGQIADALGLVSKSGKSSPNQLTHKVINVLKNQYGFNIQSCDNKYHEKIKTGKAKGSFTRKYSKLFYDVAKAMINKQNIEYDKESDEIKILPK